MEGMGKRYSWCHAVKERLGCLTESLRTGKTKEHVHSECLDMPAFVSDLFAFQYRHTSEILWVQFLITVKKQILQKSDT